LHLFYGILSGRSFWTFSERSFVPTTVSKPLKEPNVERTRYTLVCVCFESFLADYFACFMASGLLACLRTEDLLFDGVELFIPLSLLDLEDFSILRA
jgi:hypothetical protein